MLTKRIIPCLDVDKGRVVKGVNFVDIKDAGDPVEIAKKYEKDEADELVFLDITASWEKRSILIEVVHKISTNIFMPFTVGGGIRSLEDIRDILKAGADKVSINSAAVKNPGIINEASKKFGAQCIVVAIDAKKIGNSWKVFINGGRTNTELDLLEWAKEVEKRGAGEILLTSMDKDGTKEGYDIEMLKKVSSLVNIPVIASGGAGNPEHIYEVFKNTDVSAALAASIFHYNIYPIPHVKRFLLEKGIPVRACQK